MQHFLKKYKYMHSKIFESIVIMKQYFYLRIQDNLKRKLNHTQPKLGKRIKIDHL